MQKIVPHLWFDKEAGEAAKFYTSIFPDSKINYHNVIKDTPSGDAETLEIEILGFKLAMLSGGPLFKLNPSISFLVNSKQEDEVEDLWEKLSEGSKVLMELGEYPFSKKYGWLEDKYGLSWQIMLTDQDIKQRIIPTLMFTGEKAGKAEEAVNFYTSLFKNTEIDHIMRYEKNDEPDKEGTIRHVGFKIEDVEFAAMDSAREHDFTFNEAVSFMVFCEDQQEIDYYWEKLTAVPEAEQCGWLKDKYGVSWQVVPTVLGKLTSDKDPEKVKKVTEAFLKMKKFDIAQLQKAYAGE